MKVINEVSVCTDCVHVLMYGDFSGLDMLPAMDAEQRKELILAGMNELEGLPVYSHGKGFCVDSCECCMEKGYGERYVFNILGE